VKTMYTKLKRGKKLRLLTETPSVLGTAVAAAAHGVGEYGLLELIVAYTNCDATHIATGLPELVLQALGEIHLQGGPTDQQNEVIQRASEELQKSQPKFRAAMSWLCSSKNEEETASPNRRLLGSGKVEWGRYPLIDKTSEDFIAYFENHGLNHFKSRLSLQEGRLLLVPRLVHLIDLFCACILDRCLGRRSSEMPIKMCRRCRKFFSSERSGFCSKDCQWKHYWTPERRSDDKWVKDLEKFSDGCELNKYGRSIADLRKKLASPKVIRRLKSIKAKIDKENWAGWGKISQRIKTVEKRAAEPKLHR
jgi:hypothetical protein